MSDFNWNLVTSDDAAHTALSKNDSEAVAAIMHNEYLAFRTAADSNDRIQLATRQLHLSAYGVFVLGVVQIMTPALSEDAAEISAQKMRCAAAARNGAAVLIESMRLLEMRQIFRLNNWASSRTANTLQSSGNSQLDAEMMATQGALGYCAFQSELGNRIAQVGSVVANNNDEVLQSFCSGAGLVMSHIIESDRSQFEVEMGAADLSKVRWDDLPDWKGQE